MRTGLRVVHQASGLFTRHIVPLLSPRLARQPGRLIVVHIASCTAASPWPSCLVLESTQTQIEPHVRLQLLVSTHLENDISLSVSFSMTISKALCSHGICNPSEAISSLRRLLECCLPWRQDHKELQLHCELQVPSLSSASTQHRQTVRPL